MPVVTDINKQKRRETRFSVYVDGKFAFGLSDLDLSTSGLRVGQELTASEVAGFVEQAGQAKAYTAAVRLIGVRPRSRREVMDFLRRKGYSDEEAESVLGRLEGTGLVDDAAFAASWIDDRQALRPRSRRRLAQELAAKGVSREDAEGQLAAVDEEAELMAARRLVQKKRRLPQYADDQKLVAYMMRQGFSYATVRRAMLQV